MYLVDDTGGQRLMNEKEKKEFKERLETERCCICHKELDADEIYDYNCRVFCEEHFLEEVNWDCKRTKKGLEEHPLYEGYNEK